MPQGGLGAIVRSMAKTITCAGWRVRITMWGAGIVHALSTREPKCLFVNGALVGLDWDPVASCGEAAGDTIGYIEWSEVCAVSWRWGE